MNQPLILMFGMPGTIELIVIGAVALLIFGRRLPEVARSLGKSIVEFKRGIKDVKDDVAINPRIEPPKQARIDSQPVSPPPNDAAPRVPQNDAPPANQDADTKTAGPQ